MPRIAVGWDCKGWHRRFLAALEEHAGSQVSYYLVEPRRDDWVTQVDGADLLLWNAMSMGPRSAQFYKEKVLFLERYKGLRVIPNYATLWHFESKVAQSYLLRDAGVRTPKTVVSFTLEDALERLDEFTMPLVFKESHGAGSSRVRLVHTRNEADLVLHRAFAHDCWQQHRAASSSKVGAVLRALNKPWFVAKVQDSLLRRFYVSEDMQYVYWQEFIPGNSKDLRITVIGNRFAYAFWRQNRPGDFRASGSGRIVYDASMPEEPLRYCLSLNERFGFDSMAYDLLWNGTSWVIVEMSYSYLDTALYQTPGHYALQSDGQLVYQCGCTWPQSLWVRWALSQLAGAS